jgi:hypothetical protein
MAKTKAQKIKAPKTTMWFSNVYSVQGTFLRRQSDGPIRATLPTLSNIIVTLTPARPHQIKGTVEGLFCEALAIRGVKKDVTEMLQSIERGLLPLDETNQAKLPYTSFSEPHTIIDIEGHIAPNHAVPLEYLPQRLDDFVRATSRDLIEAARRFITTLRWRQRASTAVRPFSSLGSFWSSDGNHWNRMPGGVYAVVAIPTGIAAGPERDEAINKLLQNDEYEPLAHELAREALALCETSPRSALITAVVALETGVKHYIKDAAPNTSWLIENLPSPPVERLMTEYIPEINATARRPELPLTSKELDLLKKRISQRNHVAHGASSSVDARNLKEFIKFVINVLYRLDFCRGLTWAQELACLSTNALASRRRDVDLDRWPHEDSSPTHGHEPTREAAMGAVRQELAEGSGPAFSLAPGRLCQNLRFSEISAQSKLAQT